MLTLIQKPKMNYLMSKKRNPTSVPYGGDMIYCWKQILRGSIYNIKNTISNQSEFLSDKYFNSDSQFDTSANAAVMKSSGPEADKLKAKHIKLPHTVYR